MNSQQTSQMSMEPDELDSNLEALLFASEEPLSVAKLRDLVNSETVSITLEQVQESLTRIENRYTHFSHGMELYSVAGGFQFRTKLIRSPIVKKLSKIQVQKLSKGSMETLAIIAYKQPLLREEIDQIRGVDSSYFLRILLERGLIEMSGRSDLPGRPIVYRTSSQFLKIFGLTSLDHLPPLRELEQMVPTSEALAKDSDPKIKALKEWVSSLRTSANPLDYNPSDDEEILGSIREKVRSIAVSTPALDALEESESSESSKSKDEAPPLLSTP